ncbi:hypothetical protein BC829DRAFT_177078 [Chytridium lagenaria]|nr:hypothetical protein BC829DRAFT_177078 [Chytridium lagenaria]
MPRYFFDGQCKFCRKTGHVIKDCKERETQCFLCKEDHDSMKCPLAEVCFNCYRLGHQRKDCSQAYSRNRYCDFCRTSMHDTEECGLVWRRYTLSGSVHSSKRITMYCFNCGTDGHFGDECGIYRPGPKGMTAFNLSMVSGGGKGYRR